MTTPPPLAVAEVRVADDHDHLVVVPLAPGTMAGVRAALSRSLGDVRVGRGVGGLAIAAAQAPRLLELPAEPGLRWTTEARRFAHNRALAVVQQEVLRRAIRDLQADGRQAAARALPELPDLDVLDDHQVINVAVMTHPACYGLCLFDEQGAGKTVTGIYAMDVLAARDQVDFTLVVAPKSMVPEWQSDLERFRPGLYSSRNVVGARRQKRAALASGADVLVTNFETVVALEAELVALARKHDGRCLLIVDESFFVKNLDARRTRALRRLREWFGRAYVLCGTPAPNSAHDLLGQFNLADFGVTFAGVTLPEEREEAQVVVRQVLDQRAIYLRSLKQDVLPGLPSKAFHVVRVPLAPMQHRAYEAALRDLIVDLHGVDDPGFQARLTSFMARRSALLQICSNPRRLIPDYHETPAKLQALEGLIDELLVKQGEKLVVWSFYTASLEAIVDHFAHLNPLRYDGEVADVNDRREAVRRFQEDKAARLFVANPAAAGAGLTLHAARYAIYESVSNQAAHFLQSLDRLHRRGQAREVRYVVLLADRTLEEDAFDLLRSKERAAQQLLGDATEPPTTREQWLYELRGAAKRINLEPS